MCGIVGAAGQAARQLAGDLPRMRDMLQHRGPDDAGLWSSSDGVVVFGHRRLAIIDTSERGNQPMSDATQSIWITFNGEIYNYRELRDELTSRGHAFQTETDTEVLLEAYREWGSDCLVRLHGMFAFALYDTTRRTVLLARDRAGEKPLYVWQRADGIAFASELKALAAVPDFPRRIDAAALDHYLAYGYVTGTMCIFAGVRKLAPAEAMEYSLDSGAVRSWKYWTLPANRAEAGAPVEELVERLDGLLFDAVRRQLVADVPVGILLSGGLDSSLVTAMAARATGGKVKTFTVTFPGHARFDEGPFARLVASHFGTEHIELTAAQAHPDILPQLARQFDEPMADSSMIPTYLVSVLIRKYATVALGGDGGDELFGGYPHYNWIASQARLRGVVPGPLRAAISYSAARLLPYGTRGRNHLIGLAGDIANSIAHINLYFDQGTRDALTRGALDGHRSEALRRELCAGENDPSRAAMMADFRSYLPDDLLVKVDRASMLTSLEVRAPMLDPAVIEFAFGEVPTSLKIGSGQRKILLRKLAARLLPPSLDLTRKQGFSIPLTDWMKGEWGASMRSVLLDAEGAFFDRRVVEKLFREQSRGRNNSQRLFALMMFELWRQEYRATF